MAEIYSVFTITWRLPPSVEKVGVLAFCFVVPPPTVFLDRHNRLPPSDIYNGTSWKRHHLRKYSRSMLGFGAVLVMIDPSRWKAALTWAQIFTQATSRNASRKLLSIMLTVLPCKTSRRPKDTPVYDSQMRKSQLLPLSSMMHLSRSSQTSLPLFFTQSISLVSNSKRKKPLSYAETLYTRNPTSASTEAISIKVDSRPELL